MVNLLKSLAGKLDSKISVLKANLILDKFQPSLIHVVGDIKLDAQEKLFVLTTFSEIIGLCRVSVM